MEPILTEALCLKDPAPQDDGDDENVTPSMHPPNNLPDSLNIGPLPNLVQNESISSVSTSNSTSLSKTYDADADNSTIVINFEDSNQSSAFLISILLF